MIQSCLCPYCGKKHLINVEKFTKIQKIAIFIDGGNLYHAAKELRFKVDFLRLRDYLCPKNMEIFGVFYYTAYDPTEGFIMKILDWLKHNGFIVVSKEVKKIKNSYFKGNMDVELTCDMLLNLDQYDQVVLISGDGDFTRCVVELQKRNKYVQVVSTEQTTPPLLAQELKIQADSFIELATIIPYICQV